MLKVHAKNLGTFTVLCLQGQIVNGETRILLDSVNSLSQSEIVILDLTNVTTVDAHGLGVLLEVREQCLEKGMRLELMNVSVPMRKVLEITRLDSVFHITPKVEFFQAVSSDYRVRARALKSCA